MDILSATEPAAAAAAVWAVPSLRPAKVRDQSEKVINRQKKECEKFECARERESERNVKLDQEEEALGELSAKKEVQERDIRKRRIDIVL